MSTDANPDSDYALEPRFDAPKREEVNNIPVRSKPSIVSSVAGKIRIPNLTSEPHSLKRNEHFCQVRPVFTPVVNQPDSQKNLTNLTQQPPTSPVKTKHSTNVRLDLDNLLPPDIRSKFSSLLDEYDHVFDPNIEGYNGAEGPFEAKVNMGPVEPPPT